MLASTVQFSNNDQAHHQPPTPNHHSSSASAGCAGPVAPDHPPHQPLPQEHPVRARSEETPLARLFPQDPTVCLAPTPSRPALFLPHTSAGRTRSLPAASRL
jgi:hypothetical protein